MSKDANISASILETSPTGGRDTAPVSGVDGHAALTTTAPVISYDVSRIESEMVRDRLDAVAARTGLDEAYADVALAMFTKTGKEPTRANLTSFVEGLKKDKPALFRAAPAVNTAPVMPAGTPFAPAAPAPGAVDNPHAQWRALEASGRKAEAEAFYLLNRRAILRG